MEKVNVSLGRHESFYIRENWLRKGIIKVKENKQIFAESKKNKTVDPVEEFGIGANMVTALKYWLKTTGLIHETKSGNEYGHLLTDLGEQILEHDPFFEYDGTYSILHYNICKNLEAATTWNWFFNHFNKRDFTRTMFITTYHSFLQKKYNYIPSEKMIEKEFGCFIKTYTDNKISIKESNFEDKINSPFTCLKLIKTKFSEDTNREMYFKNYSEDKNIDPEIIGYILLKEKNKNSSQVQLSEAYKIIGNLFNSESLPILESIERLTKDNRFKNQFTITQKADINNLSFNNENINADDLLNKYYERVKD